MEFFNSAIEVLQTLVVALGAGLGVWGGFRLPVNFVYDSGCDRWIYDTVQDSTTTKKSIYFYDDSACMRLVVLYAVYKPLICHNKYFKAVCNAYGSVCYCNGAGP